MTEIEELRESVAALSDRQSALEGRVGQLEARVDTLDSKMDTLLDGVSQIKACLNDNTKTTKSARRNTRGWGFISALISVISAAARVIL